MRTLTPKERRLLIALVATLFVLLNVVGLRAFLNRQGALRGTIAKLQQELDLSRTVLAQKDYWAERAAWLAANQPVDDTSTIEDDGKFYEFVETSAKKHGLQYTRKAGNPLPQTGSYVEVYDASQVKGRMESLVKWFDELQQPKAFRAIKQLSIKSDAEPPDVICEIEVARWYRPGKGGETKPEEAAP